MTQAERQVFWQGHVNRWRASSLSIDNYCAQQGISRTTFGMWRRRLADEPARRQREGAGFVPVVVAETPNAKSGDLRQHTLAIPIGRAKLPEDTNKPSRNLEIRVRGGRTICIANDFDETVLSRLITLLERLPSPGHWLNSVPAVHNQRS